MTPDRANPWTSARAGDLIGNGPCRFLIVARGVPRKREAQQLADRWAGGKVWLDGPHKWAVVVHRPEEQIDGAPRGTKRPLPTEQNKTEQNSKFDHSAHLQPSDGCVTTRSTGRQFGRNR